MEMEKTQEDCETKVRCSILKTCWNYIVRNILLVSSLMSVVLGIAVGTIVKTYFTIADVDKLYISFPGEMLMRMLRSVTIPLIVTSVIRGVSGLSANISRKIATRAAVYFGLTTLVSVTVGLILVLMIKPGVAYTVHKVERDNDKKASTVDALLDVVRNMVPDNLIVTSFHLYKTKRLEFEIHTVGPNSSLETNATEVHLVGHHVQGVNTLGLIVCSFVFGLTLKRMGKRGTILVDMVVTINEATKYVVNLILCYLPLGVLFIIVSKVIEVHNWNTAYKLGMFMAVVVIGLIIYGVIVLPTIYLLWVRRNPWPVIKGVSPALVTALLISSSSATLPLTFRCCEDRNMIDRRISRFMLPIGTNISKGGTALYEVVAVVFIAQLNSINLGMSQLITIVLTAAVSSIGAAGIPSAGAVTTLFVLAAVGLPARDATILVVVEWMLDHVNTFVNVLGNCIGVALVNQLSNKELQKMEEQDRDRTSSQGSLETTEFLHTAPEM